MRELPQRLRWYLWAIYLACGLLVGAQIGSVAQRASWWPGPPVTIQALAIFILLAYIGERASVAVSGSVELSLATPVHVAVILLFPPPFPVLITLVAALASQAVHERSPLHKRAFNVCHPTLAVGLSGALVSLVAVPTHLLRPGHILAAVPALVLLTVLYYLLDVGALLGVLSLLESRSPWQVWWLTNRRTALPEIATSAIGILAAVAWQYDHVLLAVFALPVVALGAAFRVIAQAEHAQRMAEDAQGRAEAALRVRDEFLTAASHDLRTPLTSVMGYAEVMQMRLEHGATADEAWVRSQLGALLRAARRMAATVEEITDAAQLQMGQHLTLNVDTVDVGEMVQAVASLVRAAAPRPAPVEVDTHSGVTMEGDRMRLERVMQNIIGNAVKYNLRDAPIHVDVEQREQSVIITVRDRGVGIPADELPHIFTHFYRATTSIGIKGTGVGLAGSKSIVEQHGGHITVQSALGQGTTVVITLPTSFHDAQSKDISRS